MGCIPYSLGFYIERRDVDTNQSIVEMSAPGKSHWYYRSDQFVASRFGLEGTDYTGPIGEIPSDIRDFYSEFKFAPKAMEWARLSTQLNCKGYDDFLSKLRDKKREPQQII